MSECKELQDECAVAPRAAQAWSVCLPWGGRIWSDGLGVYAQPGSPPPDGTYGTITIANGCIVGVGPVEVPLYTGSPCAPLPGNCGRSVSATAAAMVMNDEPVVLDAEGMEGPSLAQGNLYTLDAVGRPLVRCEIAAGAGVAITGNGTASSPYRISSTGGIAVQSRVASANDAITVNDNIIAHKSGKQGLVNGMVFDAYGHLIDATSGSVNKGIQAINAGEGIEGITDFSTMITSLRLRDAKSAVAGRHTLGGMEAELDSTGRIQSVTQTVDLGEEQIIRAGTHDVRISALGAITEITNRADLGAVRYIWLSIPDTNDAEPLTELSGAFTLPFATGLAGLFFAGGTPEFLSAISFVIDDSICLRTSGEAGPIAFTNSGVFSAGTHSFKAVGASAWSTQGAFVMLFAAGQ